MQAKGMGVSLHPAQAVWLAKAAVERAAGLRPTRDRTSSAVIPNPVSNCAWVRPLNWESMADCSPMRFFFRPSGTFSFPATDPLKHIDVDVGDRVRKGQTLAVLEVPELQEEVNQAEASGRQSEQEVQQAIHELKRAEAN